MFEIDPWTPPPIALSGQWLGFDDFGLILSPKWVSISKIPGNWPKMAQTKKFLRIMFVKWHQKKGCSLVLRIGHFYPLPLISDNLIDSLDRFITERL